MGRKNKGAANANSPSKKQHGAVHNNNNGSPATTSVSPSKKGNGAQHVTFAGLRESSESGAGDTGRGSRQQNGHQDTDYYLPPFNKGGLKPSRSAQNLMIRKQILLWTHPLTTLNYFCREMLLKSKEFLIRLWSHRVSVILVALLSVTLYYVYFMPGPHQKAVQYFEKKMLWSAYWVGLGVLSSVGFGTGLHTFLLYLGPHIASVTLAAFECQSLQFPEPPYPDEIICPDAVNNRTTATVDGDSGSIGSLAIISMWAIMSKVRLEAFMWGAGTAFGELPPFFMARAAAVSGEEPDDEEYKDFKRYHALLAAQDPRAIQSQGIVERLKIWIEKAIEQVGFLGILLCASIPNPFFDLAGITCGHFGVPFWKFFGATLIGKAVVKMHIQKLFVILTFSEHHVENLISMIKNIPKVGVNIQAPFREYLQNQKRKLHSRSDAIVQNKSLLARFFDSIVLLMILWFVLSLINSFAQNYHKRLCRRQLEEEKQRFQAR